VRHYYLASKEYFNKIINGIRRKEGKGYIIIAKATAKIVGSLLD
jgi:hypothetical protein